MQVLNAMKCDLLEMFISSAIELVLDQPSMFVWQNYSHSCKEAPPYTTLLECLHLQAWSLENTIRENDWKHLPASFDRNAPSRPSYIADIEENCVACKATKHPLHGYKVLQTFRHNRKMASVKENGLCINCLITSRHLLKQCPSTRKCKKSQKPPILHYVSTSQSDPTQNLCLNKSSL